MTAQLIHDRVVMECLEGVWETLKDNERCQFYGTVRLTATSLPMEWILPTPTPYRLVEPVQLIEVSSSEEDLEEDPEELPCISIECGYYVMHWMSMIILGNFRNNWKMYFNDVRPLEVERLMALHIQ
ncbi:hypothetical protein HKD37_14G040500 [Glycine soja]